MHDTRRLPITLHSADGYALRNKTSISGFGLKMNKLAIGVALCFVFVAVVFAMEEEETAVVDNYKEVIGFVLRLPSQTMMRFDIYITIVR